VKSPPKTFADAFDVNDNNFNLIRMVAATLVLVSHCFPLAGINNWEPFAYYLGGYDTGGGWGVSIFFVISGFLVTRSVLYHTAFDYLLSRVLRIVPALALAMAVTVFIIGPFFTSEPILKYFISPETWRYLLNVNVFELTQRLPGLFAANPFAGAVNGSLWTLPIECGFYVLLPVMAVAGLLLPRAVLGVLILTTIAYIVNAFLFHLDWNNQGGTIFRGAPLYSTARAFLFFVIGSCFWVWRSRIVYSHGLALVMVGVLYLFADQPFRTAAFYVGLPYIVMYTAFTTNIVISKYQDLGDYSYGTYIFAFPIQQSIVAILGVSISPSRLFWFAAPITFVLAFLSWRFVERPALGLRKRLFRSEHLFATPIDDQDILASGGTNLASIRTSSGSAGGQG
jgi:peptidoglycan/LPS O-acetylase OafA/YrhL